METLEQIKSRIEAAVPGAKVELIHNDSPSGQVSLLVDSAHGLDVVKFLRDDAQLKLDYLSNATGIDWPDTTIKEKVKVKKTVDGVEKEIEETIEKKRPGYLEAVYHLFSMAAKHGPVILRMRTEDRAAKNHLPSLTPIWRGAEFQEREIFDLYGIVFDGHPDLRRILMWDGYQDHPMRKDYREPDDYEYEPTPHDEVLEKGEGPIGGKVMSDEFNEAAAVEYQVMSPASPYAALAEELYRQRVVEARQMSPEEKILAGQRLFEYACRITLAGIRNQFPGKTEEEYREILRERLAWRRKMEAAE